MSKPLSSRLADSGAWTPSCPEIHRHTPCPDGYVAWHEWAEQMSKTHRQQRCPRCGLYQIWIRVDGGT